MHAVTGAFGYTGRYLTQRLLARGQEVLCLTGHPERPSPFGEQVGVARLAFDQPDSLTETLRGVEVLYNSFWIRFAHGGLTFDHAVAHSQTLITAAVRAGVKRIVHVSVTNPTADSQLPYFRGKAQVEQAVRESGLPYAILRPTLVFGPEDILINNIAWLLRRLPGLAVPGRGDYRLQPVWVEDLADLEAAAGQRDDSYVIDAAGPEVLTYDQMVHLIAEAVRSRARIVHLPPRLAYALAWVVGRFLGDVVITWDEIAGLSQDLLVSREPPTCPAKLSDWLQRNAATVGNEYHSELARHYL